MSPFSAAMACELVVVVAIFVFAAIIVNGGAVADFLAQVAQ